MEFPRDTLATDTTPIIRIAEPEPMPWRHCDNSLMGILNGSAFDRDRAFAQYMQTQNWSV
jgi:hypothetical protein